MTDTSAETVKQMAAYIQGGDLMTDDRLDEAAATLRALVAERDAAVERGNDWCDQAKKARGERDAALAREAELREALDGLMVAAVDYVEWVVKNPDCAADPCAEAHNLACALSEAWNALSDADPTCDRAALAEAPR